MSPAAASADEEGGPLRREGRSYRLARRRDTHWQCISNVQQLLVRRRIGEQQPLLIP